MAEEIEDLDSTTQEPDEQEELETEEVTEDDDLDAVREKLTKAQEANKKLFARAKKGEGFEQVDGKWTKKPEPKTEPKPEPKTETPPKDEDVLKRIDERFEQRDLEELEASEDLKKEIRNYAKLNSVNIKKAFNSEYIQFKLDKERDNERIEGASLGGGKRRPSAKLDYSQVDPSKFDLSTEEDKRQKAEWEEHVKKNLG